MNGYRIGKKPKYLNLTALAEDFRSNFAKDPHYIEKNPRAKYNILDSLSSGLACMFLKSKSLLRYQERMSRGHYKSNLKSQFNVYNIPKSTQMRTLLGKVKEESFQPVFKKYIQRLQRNNDLMDFSYNGYKFLTVDGTQCYSSKKITCPCCLTQESGDVVNYSHQVLQPIISHPDQKEIFPLMPEEISNSDGSKKQDCEINATKRSMCKIRKDYPKMKFIHMGDALFATTPYIEEIRKKVDDRFILRVKAGSHSSLYNSFNNSIKNTHEITNAKGQRFIYKWTNNLKLFKTGDLIVNAMELFIVSKDKNGKQTSRRIGIWVTDIELSQDNIEFLVKAGRSRWKIENEGFQTLKKRGYEIDHSWGHSNGECFIFYLLNIIGFFIHQILIKKDELLQEYKACVRRSDEVWGDIKYIFRFIYFDSWEKMLEYLITDYKKQSGVP